MFANTKIEPKNLTNEDLNNIYEVYKSVGLPILNDLKYQVSLDLIKKELIKNHRSFEIKPWPHEASNNKLIISSIYDVDNNKYINALISPVENSIKEGFRLTDLFDKKMREYFLK